MKFLALTLGVMLSLAMGGKSPPRKPLPDAQNAPSGTVVVLPEVVVTPEGQTLVTATVKGKASDARRIQRLHDLTPVVQAVLNDPDFESAMLKAWYNGKPGFASSKSTPAQVMAKLKGTPWVQFYEFAPARKSTLGWTYPSTKTVWFNSNNFDGRKDCGLVGTRFHEETHKRGEDHDDKPTKRRPFSVPYYTGTQASLVCAKLLKNGLIAFKGATP